MNISICKYLHLCINKFITNSRPGRAGFPFVSALVKHRYGLYQTLCKYYYKVLGYQSSVHSRVVVLLMYKRRERINTYIARWWRSERVFSVKLTVVWPSVSQMTLTSATEDMYTEHNGTSVLCIVALYSGFYDRSLLAMKALSSWYHL